MDRVECEYCDKTYSSVYNMNRHVESAHQESEDEIEESEGEQIEESENEESENEENEESGEDEYDGNTIWEDYAEDAANLSDLNAKRKYVIKRYVNDVYYTKRFSSDPINQRIIATKRKFLEDADEDEELTHDEALKLAIAKRQEIIHEAANLLSDEEESGDDIKTM